MGIVKRVCFSVSYGAKELKSALKEFKGFKKVTAFFDMMWCWCRYGASPKNYLWFNFQGANGKERKTYMTHRKNKKIANRFNKPESIYKVQDKFAFAEILGEQYGRLYAKSNQMDFSTFEKIAQKGRVVYKPLTGAQGAGISVFSVEEGLTEIYSKIISLPVGIVEEWIEQHEDMSGLYSDAVNPLRIQTLYVGDEVHIIAGTVTIANGTKIANASAPNSIFALIDVKTGKVFTDGCDYSGNYFLQHPETKKEFKGFQIPYWNEVVKLVTKTAKCLPDVRHIGWDVAICKDGPIIIEANETPGYTAFQVYKLTKTQQGIMPEYNKLIK